MCGSFNNEETVGTTEAPQTIDAGSLVGEVSVAEFAAIHQAVSMAITFGAPLGRLYESLSDRVTELTDTYGFESMDARVKEQNDALQEEHEALVAASEARLAAEQPQGRDLAAEVGI